MRVPPRKLCVHGVGGSPRSGGVSTRSTGSSSLAGVPGGSSSYGTSENTTSPTGASPLMTFRSERRTSP